MTHKLVQIEPTKAMIEAGDEIADIHYEYGETLYLKNTEEVYKAMLEASPTTDTVTGWISVDDRLPLDREFVLVLCPSGYTTIKNTVVTARLDSVFRGNRWIDHANDLLTDSGLTPTHWRPMFTPPIDQAKDE
jgi:hypothetical protein